jgi:hypothetical protein
MAQHVAVGVYQSLDAACAALRSLGSELPFALLGGAEKGMAGPMPSVAGWLFHAGLASETVLGYDAAIKEGKVLVVVHGNQDTATKGRAALASSGAEQLEQHAPGVS